MHNRSCLIAFIPISQQKRNEMEVVLLTINERLFQLLTDQRQTQKGLADFIVVNERNIATWKARGSDPPAKLISKIADFFNVSIEWMLTGEDQHGTSFVNNGSVSGTLGQHYGTLIIQNGGERALSDECAELIRIYESLEIKQRIRLLDFAFSLEDGKYLEISERSE